TILYVRDQQASAAFYQKIFRKAPDLDVPGMTEFILAEQVKLGLMPNRGIARILGDGVPHPDEGSGIPRCELYLYVDDLRFEYENALKAGARLLSPPALRDWGDRVCYLADPDGHVIAFAEKNKQE
ncbi:MAG: lactoylglutathione lyase, partial [Candidatus Marinimicrobia bacterium]|nr:lactoylglutathione lyase [Candidatus Neomarinimicrobiota bacterium]